MAKQTSKEHLEFGITSIVPCCDDISKLSGDLPTDESDRAFLVGGDIYLGLLPVVYS